MFKLYHLVATAVFEYNSLVKSSDQLDIEQILVYAITVLCSVFIQDLYVELSDSKLVPNLLALTSCVLRHILAVGLQ